MAERAGLILSSLVMERRSAGRVRERCRMARQAQKVHVADLQQVNVGRAVGGMARLATFHLHGFMFENKWAALVGVTGKADRVLRCRGSHLLRSDRPVRVVTVSTLDQTLVDAMVKWHAELGPLLQMAGVAKLGLGLYQEELLRLRMTWRVAGDAADVTFRMQGINGVHLLGTRRVTGQAAVIDFFGGMVFEDKNLCYIPASGNVSCPGTMAALASLARWPPFRI